MRVGLLIDRWDPLRGGAERALDQLARHLAGAGHEVHVFGARCKAQPPGEFHAVRSGGRTRGARMMWRIPSAHPWQRTARSHHRPFPRRVP